MERGVLKRVSTPYDEPSPDCVGCGACAEVCPTGAISMTEKEKPDGSITRSIWGKDFELVRCEECGKPFATREEIEAARAAVDEPHKPAADKQRLLCRDCRREEMTRVFAASLGA
jgi:ferredoxin